jgi:NAD(P)-dependent dehydrogenase (short-subunit alcohol dehydrogenase family)
MNDLLLKQNVVVLGGSSGLGFAVAALAAAQGANVFAVSRSGAAPESTKGIKVDVSDRDALDRVFGMLGRIDHLVHTVGARFGSTPLASLEDTILRAAFEAKLFSAVHAVRLALPHLAPTSSITLSSGQVSRKYSSGSLVKGALNAAVDAAGRHLAKELAPRRVNVISPGVVDTNLWGEPGSAARDALITRVSAALPVGRIGRPEELARVYLMLMTNGFITGSVLDIDGGGLL